MSVDVGDAATDHPLALRPGTTLDDRYRLLRLLGGTSCAASYLAQDDRTSELVVIEEFLPRALVTRQAAGIVRPHTATDETEFARAAKRFAREGERLSEIDHPNLLRVHRAFEANGTAYVVMSHREAVPLHGFVAGAGGRLGAVAATEFVRRLLDALEAMHAEGVFHRSLSPASVHVDATGRPLLQSVSASRHLASQSRDLVEGFAPIELYGNKGVGPWTDVYSASALLYYLVTGVAPTSAIDRAAGQILVAPTTLVGGLPASLVTALMRGLAQLPEQRPHSASELARQLSGNGSSAAATSVVATVQTAAPLPELANLEQSAFNAPLTASTPTPFTDQSTALRLTAGVVMPEHDNLAGRVKKWLSAYRLRGDDHGSVEDEQAVLDAASRMAVPLAPAPAVATPPAALPPAPAPSPATPPSAASPAGAPPDAVPDVIAEESALTPTAESVAPAVEAEAEHADAAPVVESVRSALSANRNGSRPVATKEPEPRRPTFELALPSLDKPPALPDEPGLPAEESREPLVRRPAIPRLAAFANKRTTRTLWSVGAVMLLGAAVAGAAWAARSGNDRTERVSPTPAEPRQAGTAVPLPADSAKRPVHSEAAGALAQGGSTATADSMRNAFRGERPKTPGRTEGRPDSSASALAALASVNVAVAAPNTAPQLLPTDVIIDIRDRLSQGRQLAEGGDYAAARRAFRAALQVIDSASTKYVSSDALRTMRQDVEKEAQSALEACNAENEFRKRRDGKTLSCG